MKDLWTFREIQLENMLKSRFAKLSLKINDKIKNRKWGFDEIIMDPWTKIFTKIRVEGGRRKQEEPIYEGDIKKKIKIYWSMSILRF